MSLAKKFLGQLRTGQGPKGHSPLVSTFIELEGRPDFPFALAVNSLQELEREAKNQEELFQYLIEDSIFASLYATFYEQLLIAIHEHSELALKLIESFQSDSAERERIIAEQTHYHLDFVLNKGLCSGCPACENHTDVADLLSYFQKGDISFFLNLYLGMQTIQYSMENLIYDVIPRKIETTQYASQNEVIEFRKYLYNYAQNKGI